MGAKTPGIAIRAGAPGGRSRFADRAFRWGTLVAAGGLVVLLGLMLWVLASGGAAAFRKFGFGFLTGSHWNPVLGRESFGAWPYIFGTIVTSVIAVVLAVPVAVGVALLLNEMKRGWLRDPLAVFVDLLAAIPSVVYGLWGFFVLVPLFNHQVEPFLAATLGKLPVVGSLFGASSYVDPVTHQVRYAIYGGNILIAGVLLAIMILPIVTAVSREVIAIVPRELREASKALGATNYESIRMSVLPFARSGIVGATMLGLGRALGETIAVALVIGANPSVGPSLLEARYTIPAKIADSFREATGLQERSALLAMALILVAIALAMAAMSRLLLRRSRRLMREEGA